MGCGSALGRFFGFVFSELHVKILFCSRVVSYLVVLRYCMFVFMDS